MGVPFACKCDHAFQDAQYGPGKRYHVAMKNGDLRCTVCGSEKSPKTGDEVKKKK